MAIEVEDGSGKVDAVSYVSVADATTYFTARGDETWAEQESTTQEAALVRATAAIDSWLRGRWLGTKKTQAQSLAWPRTGVVDEEGFDILDTTIPTPLKQATCEVAMIELSERFLQQSVSKDNTIASETVGPISVSYRADAPTVKTYPHVEALLRGLASIGGAQMAFSISLTDDEKAALDGSSDNYLVDLDAYMEDAKWS